MRGASTVLGGVCADLPQKCGKAALSYSTQSVTLQSIRPIGRAIFMRLEDYQEIKITGSEER